MDSRASAMGKSRFDFQVGWESDGLGSDGIMNNRTVRSSASVKIVVPSDDHLASLNRLLARLDGI